jgi:hypothetical protein
VFDFQKQILTQWMVFTLVGYIIGVLVGLNL